MYILQSSKKRHIKIPQNKSFENIENLERVETNQTCMHEEINTRLNSVNTCYHSMSNFLPSCFVF